MTLTEIDHFVRKKKYEKKNKRNEMLSAERPIVVVVCVHGRWTGHTQDEMREMYLSRGIGPLQAGHVLIPARCPPSLFLLLLLVLVSRCWRVCVFRWQTVKFDYFLVVLLALVEWRKWFATKSLKFKHFGLNFHFSCVCVV